MIELERKYVDLILQRCVNFEQAKSLMIHCDFKEHIAFAELLKQRANELGIFDVCINVNDLDDIHDYLMTTPVEDIKLNPIINKSAWNEYAKKGGALVFLNSTAPGLMDDVPAEKIEKWHKESETVVPYYRANVSKYAFPWCIVGMPNERWARSLFPDCDNAYERLYLYIMKMCMIDTKDPVLAWQEYIEGNNYFKNRLNELSIRTMHFQNSLGTDLTLEIPEGNIWLNLDKTDAKGGQMIANMPSYEIFTTPDYRKTNGIVYSSRPLVYGGKLIEDFSITFKDGKVVSVSAKKGQELLEKIIYETPGAEYLGEVALVQNDSPISNTGLVFNTTLYDENASCHLALGRGFSKTFPGSETATDEELHEKGLNLCKNHIDFMIGTPDLDITAQTSEGQKLVFKKGNFNI